MAQTASPFYDWDIQANHLYWYLASNSTSNGPGVTYPFVIEAGAPSGSFRVNNNGSVGLGTAFPATRLHVVQSAVSGAESVARFQVGDDTVGGLTINNASAGAGVFHPRLQGLAKSQAVPLTLEGLIGDDVGLNPALNFNVQRSVGGALTTRAIATFRNDQVARMTIAANGVVTATSFNPASSRAFKDRIVNLDAGKARDALRHLTPVEYVLKNDPDEPRVGFIAEDVPDLVAEADRQSVPTMDIVAVLTRVVQDQDRQLREEQDRNARQQKLLDEQRAADAELRQMLAALNQRMTELEQQLRSVAAPAK